MNVSRVIDAIRWQMVFLAKVQAREAVVQRCFVNKVLDLRPATLLKKRFWHRCFPVNFVKFLRAPFYIEHLWMLLLRLEELINKLLTK